MNPQELFDQVKDFIANKDFAGAKDFIEEHKGDLGNYFEQAKSLIEGSEGVGGIMDKVKGLFGK